MATAPSLPPHPIPIGAAERLSSLATTKNTRPQTMASAAGKGAGRALAKPGHRCHACKSPAIERGKKCSRKQARFLACDQQQAAQDGGCQRGRDVGADPRRR